MRKKCLFIAISILMLFLTTQSYALSNDVFDRRVHHKLREHLERANDNDTTLYDIHIRIHKDVEDYPVFAHTVSLVYNESGNHVFIDNSQATNHDIDELNNNIAYQSQANKIRDDEANNKVYMRIIKNYTNMSLNKRKSRIAIDWNKSILNRSVINANLTKGQILDLLNNETDIELIHLKPETAPALMTAKVSTNVRDFTYSYGLTGKDVGIYKSSALPKLTQCLTNIHSQLISGLDKTCPNEYATDQWRNHESFVSEQMVGQCGSTFSYLGISPDATMYYGCGESAANTSWKALDPSMIPRTYVVQGSWTFLDDDTSYDYLAKTWDDYAFRGRILPVFSAGNNGDSIHAPSKSFNVLSVGAFDDRSKPYYIMAGFSSYGIPISPHNDRIKPEVAAPGVNINTWSYTGWSGTSMSSPIVAGMAADLISSSPIYRLRPELVKAALMAGAVHNIEGEARLSKKDGAGGVDYLNSQFYRWADYFEGENSMFFDSNGNFSTYYDLTKGDRWRIATVWGEPGEWPYYMGGEPQMDLDLSVYLPKWQHCCLLRFMG